MKLVFALSALFVLIAGSGASAAEGHLSLWSSHAKGFDVVNGGKRATVSVEAPNNKAEVRMMDDGLTLLVNGKVRLDLTKFLNTVSLTEVSWADDSQAFFLNDSDAGEVGTWETHAYIVRDERVVEIPIASIIAKESRLAIDCKPNNVGSVLWIDGHSKIFVIEQVPNSSACSQMNAFVGYIIDVQKSEVIEVLGRDTVKARFMKDIGKNRRSLLFSN